MSTILKSSLMILLIAVGTFAQVQPPLQPPPSAPRFGQFGGYGSGFGGYGVAQPAAKPSTNNCQLELSIQRGNKTARYKLALNSGGVTTELMDRFAEQLQGLPPQTISLNAILSPFDDGGGEVTLTLNRYINYRTKAQPPGARHAEPSAMEKEVTASKSIPLMTKVALFPGKSVVIFEDEDEKISLKLTDLGSEPEKP